MRVEVKWEVDMGISTVFMENSWHVWPDTPAAVNAKFGSSPYTSGHPCRSTSIPLSVLKFWPCPRCDECRANAPINLSGSRDARNGLHRGDPKTR